jgi:hypothetical protein
MAAAGGATVAAHPSGAAWQLWSTSHGAVAVELNDLLAAPGPEASYRASADALLRGLASPPS